MDKPIKKTVFLYVLSALNLKVINLKVPLQQTSTHRSNLKMIYYPLKKTLKNHVRKRRVYCNKKSGLTKWRPDAEKKEWTQRSWALPTWQLQFRSLNFLLTHKIYIFLLLSMQPFKITVKNSLKLAPSYISTKKICIFIYLKQIQFHIR